MTPVYLRAGHRALRVNLGLNPFHAKRGDQFDQSERRRKKTERRLPLCFFGAGDRGRTDTVSLPLDFESSTSANSITPAYSIEQTILYHKSRFPSSPFLKIPFSFFQKRIFLRALVKNISANKNEREDKINVTQRIAIRSRRPWTRAADQGSLRRKRLQRHRPRPQKSHLHGSPKALRML